MEITIDEVVSKKAYPSQAQSWGIFGLLLLSSLVALVVVMALQYILAQYFVLSEDQWKAIQNFLSYVLSLGLIILFAFLRKRRYENPGFQFSFKPVSGRYFLCLFFITICLAFLLEPVTELIPMPEKIRKLFESFFDNTWLTAILVSLLGPIMEELLFRGIMLDGFLKRYSSTKAILLSSFFFGLVHLNPWQFIGAFVLGCLMGWIYWKTQSLWPCIFVHVLNNSFSTLLSFLVDDQFVSTRSFVNNEAIYWAFIVACLLMAAGFLYILKALLNKGDNQLI